MSTAKNTVIGGDYSGYVVNSFLNKVTFARIGKPSIQINKDTVKSYSQKFKDEDRSIAAGVTRQVLFGVGAATAKKTAVVVDIAFKDGKKSLIEVTPAIYKKIMAACYGLEKNK